MGGIAGHAGKVIELVKRVFDRRGRNTWDEKTRAKEDNRLAERRRADRRVRKDRRVAERRQKDTWADDPDKISRRAADRRSQSRRSGKDRRKELAMAAKIYIHELVNTTRAGIQTLPPETQLRDAVSILAIHKIGLIVVATPEKGLVGVLSERDIIRALHDQGSAALENHIADHMTRGVWTCSPNDRIAKVIESMNQNKMRHMPIVRDGELVGVISAQDLLTTIAVG